MQIDATLVVQGCNFFLFYWMVRIFLFRPVVRYLQTKEQEKQRLYDAITQYQEELAVLAEQQQRHRCQANAYFLDNRPAISPTIVEPMSNISLSNVLAYTPSDVEALVKTGSAHVLCRIIRDQQ